MPELIDRYAQIASPYLDDLPPNSCIEQTRLLRECLGRFGAAVEPIETHLQLYCPSRKVAFVSSDDGVGHVVALAEIEGGVYLVDASLAQASAYEQGLVIDRQIVTVGPLSERPRPGGEVWGDFMVPRGGRIEVRWGVRGGRGFEKTPAWEPSHLWPLIRQIVREMDRAEGLVRAVGA